MTTSLRLFAVALLASAASALAAAQPVELLQNPKTLTPATTFELRFAEPMVAPDAVGQPAIAPPLVFLPALAGTWTWTEPHRGVFAPHAPPPLGVTYRLTLREGLRKADGQPFAMPGWSETVQMPPMALRFAQTVGHDYAANLSPEPRIMLAFNANVAPATAAPLLKFINAAGNEIAAQAAPVQGRSWGRQLFSAPGVQFDEASWRDRFRRQTERETRPNQMVVTPAQPLQPGAGWRLVLAAGIPASDEALRTLEKAELSLGDVQPFVVRRAQASNLVGHGKRLILEFSKPLGKHVTPRNFARWIAITPEPEELRAEVSGGRIEFTGSFEIDRQYRVAIEPTLPCAQPLLLAQRFEQEMTFDRVPPRLYFEEFKAQQLASGGRQFRLLAVNVPSVRVTAKLFQPDTASLALDAWRRYERDGSSLRDDEPGEYFRKVETDALPGRVVFQKDFATTSETDEEHELALNWDEILGPGRTGVVLLTAEQAGEIDGQKRPGTQAVVQVTDLGLVWKNSRHESFLYAFSLATGKPLADAKLQVLDEKHAVLAEAVSDASGVARLPVVRKEGRRLVAAHSGDLHVLDFNENAESISLARFRLDEDGDERGDDAFDEEHAPEHQAILFTERGAYRPGDTAHLKGIVRDFSSGVSRVPAGKKLWLEVTDARDRRIAHREVTLSDTGAFDTDIAVPALASLGTWNAHLRKAVDDDSARIADHDFLVQEFVPNAFEITVGGPPNVLAPAEIALPVSARYYMGKPLSAARLKWSLKAEDTGFAPAGFDAFTFCDGLHDERLQQALGRVGEFELQGEDDLSPEGKATVAATIPINPKAPQPRAARLLGEITDINQQTVSSEDAFTVHASDFYLGVRDFPEVVREGAPLPIELVAVDRDGTPMPAAIDAQVRLTRIDWQTNRVEGAGGGSNYESEPRFELIAQNAVRVEPPSKQDRGWKTPAALTLAAGKPGQYLLETSATDAAGREVVTAVQFHVYGAGQMVWNYRNPFQIELVADKETYQVGEKATLLVKTPIAGDALVTVERENVRCSFVTHLAGNAPSIELPLEDADAPNVFVSVMLLRGAAESPREIRTPEYRVGYAKLTVERPAAKLSVYVRPEASAYQPGQPVTVNAEVLDHTGKAVPGADLTLYAVDEGILSLTGYETPDLLACFQAERPLGVSTGLTLPDLLSENPEERGFANKGYLIGDGGGDDAVRKNFLPCALWMGSVRAGEDGKASATFTAPDSLTRYRIIAVAQTVGDQFGSAESAFEINKPVMIEPAPPRFANVGDKLLLRAVIHNTTDHAGHAEVELALDKTASPELSNQRVAIAAHGTVAVDFPVEFKEVGQGVWIWKTEFKSADGAATFRDAAQTRLNIGYPTPTRRETHLSRIDGAEGNVLERIAPELLDGTGTVRVTVTNSRVLELGEAVRELLHYPYGCVEQTTSSTLPWMTLRSLRPSMPDLRKTDEEIAGMIERGVQRLLKMQTDSGGLAYWPGGDEPLLWASAYGGFGLAMAKRAGAPVPEPELERLCAYLSQQLRGANTVAATQDFSERCLALYTLAVAGKAEPAYHELLFQKRALLSAENRAVLAMAILEGGAEAQRPMVEALLDARDVAPIHADDFHWYGSASRQTALQLLAWSRFRKDDPAVDRLATELIGHRAGGHWATTQGNAWSLLALGEYVERVEKPGGGAAGTIAWGAQRQPFQVNAGTPVSEVAWPLGAATGPLRLSNPGRQTLFAEVRVESRPRLIEQPRRDRGYGLTRTYSKVEDDGRLSPLGEPQVGDRVLVSLNLSVRERARYLAIEDPLPSVFEAINPEFKTQATDAGEKLGDKWQSDFHELREDRALFFRDAVWPGEYTIRYLARVRAAGSATAPSAKVEEMYHPERFGQTETLRVTSLPLK